MLTLKKIYQINIHYMAQSFGPTPIVDKYSSFFIQEIRNSWYQQEYGY